MVHQRYHHRGDRVGLRAHLKFRLRGGRRVDLHAARSAAREQKHRRHLTYLGRPVLPRQSPAHTVNQQGLEVQLRPVRPDHVARFHLDLSRGTSPPRAPQSKKNRLQLKTRHGAIGREEIGTQARRGKEEKDEKAAGECSRHRAPVRQQDLAAQRRTTRGKVLIPITPQGR